LFENFRIAQNGFKIRAWQFFQRQQMFHGLK
jgi:hypothetical protein